MSNQTSSHSYILAGIVMLLTTVRNSENFDSVSTNLKEINNEAASENFGRNESPRLESGISTLHPEVRLCWEERV